MRESDGRDVNSALKNNIEGIIIKWTHQVFVNSAQCVLVLAHATLGGLGVVLGIFVIVFVFYSLRTAGG